MSKLSINFLDVSFLIPHGYTFTSKVPRKLKNSLFKVKFEDKISSADLACKIIDRKKKKNFDEKVVETLKKICHPNIVVIHSMFQDGSQSVLFIFLQWMSEGNLLEFIRKNGAVEEKMAKRWFKQILSALKYLHQHRVAHCNLSLSSILIYKNESVKLSGFSRMHLNRDKISKAKTSVSPFYQPPEVHSTQTYNPYKADVYSLGVILFIMLNNSIPFCDDIVQLIDDQINRRYHIRTSFTHKLTIDCQVMVHALLEPDAENRWPLEKISNLKWIS